MKGGLSKGYKFQKDVRNLFKRMIEDEGRIIYNRNDPGADMKVIFRRFTPRKDLTLLVQAKDVSKMNIQGLVHEYANRVREGEGRRAILIFNTEKITYHPRRKITDDEKHEILKKYGVAIWTSRTYQYYKKLVSALGKYARFTLFSDLLLNSFFSSKRYMRLKFIRCIQRKKHFYLVKLSPYILLRCSYVLRRNLDLVRGFQRLLKRVRVKKEIPEYIKYTQALLPSSIICVLSKRCRIKRNFLYLPLKYGSLIIIDGQHRVYGFHTLEETLQKEFELPCVIFDPTMLNDIEKTELFVVINSTAKKPPPNLLLDINRESILVKVTKILANSSVFKDKKGSPMISFEEIGVKDKISATTFISALNKNNILKERKTQQRVETYGYLAKLIGPNQNPEEYAKELKVYFEQWKKSFYKIWNNPKKYIISTNRGIRVILKLMPYLLKFFIGDKRISRAPKRRLKEMRKVLHYLRKRLKEKSMLLNSDLKGKYLGEGGANEMFNEWIFLMGEKNPKLEYFINPLEKTIITDPNDYKKTSKKIYSLLSRAHDHLWIADWYFDERGLDNFWIDFRCKEIRILLSNYHFSRKLKRRLLNFKNDLERKGIKIEIRIIPKKDLEVHRRILIIDGYVYTTDASWNNVFKKVTEFNLATNRKEKKWKKIFSELWNKSKSVKNFDSFN